MKSTSKVSVKQVGRATYRVSVANGRSAMTGRFVSTSAAKRSPRITVTEKRTTSGE